MEFKLNELVIACKKTTVMGFVVALLFVASGMEARAQRTMRGESLVSVGVHYPFSSPYWMGVDFSYGQYMLKSYWKAGVCATQYTHHISEEVPMCYLHAVAYGEWMYRLVGTRNRALGVYAGGGPFLGYEASDPKKLVADFYKDGIAEGSFLYGVNVSLEMEIFLSRRVAIILDGRLPMNFSSSLGWFHYQAGAGLRLNL